VVLFGRKERIEKREVVGQLNLSLVYPGVLLV
jgi:hypothetical protein